jgi:hypothetical protein
MNMSTHEFNEWNGQRLRGKNSLNVVVDLIPCQRSGDIQEWISDEIIHQTARRIRNKINQGVFGNAARRYRKELIILISYHPKPHKHFHCLIEIPDHVMAVKFQSIVSNICFKDKWLKLPKYRRATDSPVGSQIYNGSDGVDTVLIF